MTRAEYSSFDEPTVQIALRLPESLVAAIDERRGKASRATYVAITLSKGMSDVRVVRNAATTTSTKPVAASEQVVCTHPKKRRGASGLLVCEACGKVVMK